MACACAAAALALIAAPPAYAYVDPSVMTYTIQAVAGVAVALSAVLGVALRRTRKVIFRVFKVDENAKKVVEEPVIAIDSDDPEAIPKLIEADEEAKEDKAFLNRGPQPKRLNWPRRFVRALIASAFLIFTVFIMSPLEIVASSADSLNFGFFDVAPIVLEVGGASILVVALVLSIFRGRAFDVLVALVVSLGICAYVQALFMNESLPIADGYSLDLADFVPITVVSAIVWLAIVIGILVLNAKREQVCRALCLTLSVCLIIVQGVSLVSIFADEQGSTARSEANYVQTTLGMNNVSDSDGENVIVIVLDFFDTKTLERILADDPHTLDEFTGFTYFKNSTGSMIPTRNGIPFLLTGEMPRDDDTAEQFVASRYERSSFLEDVADAGYNIGIYSDSIGSPEPNRLTSNFVNPDKIEIDEASIVAILDKVALYRNMPWILKPLFWFYTDEINRASISTVQNPYVIDDAAYARTLRSEGLSLNDEDKTFRFIHLEGAHFPFVLDAQGNLSSEETDIETQGHGSLMIVSDYLRELKRLGVYDGATIIVTSDHGDWFLTDEPLQSTTSPILLVKPAEDAAQAAAPLKVSKNPTGHVDIHGTLAKAMRLEESTYGPTVFDAQDANRPRYYWMTGSNGSEDAFWLEYAIIGDVLDLDNWHETGAIKKVPK